MPEKKLNPVKNIVQGLLFGAGMTAMLMYTDDLPFNEALKEGGMMGIVFGPLMLLVDIGWLWIDKARKKKS